MQLASAIDQTEAMTSRLRQVESQVARTRWARPRRPERGSQFGGSGVSFVDACSTSWDRTEKKYGILFFVPYGPALAVFRIRCEFSCVRRYASCSKPTKSSSARFDVTQRRRARVQFERTF